MNRKLCGRCVLFFFLFLGMDQLSKWFIVEHLSMMESQPIIPPFFSFTYVQNTGAAFSILEGKLNFFMLISFAAFLFLIYYIFKKKNWTKLDVFLYALLGSGILGNLMDRICYGYVIDFFDFHFGKYQFAIFNIADICIVLGGALFIYLVWKEETYEKNNNRK